MSLVANVWNALRQHFAQLITTAFLMGLLLLTSCSPSESSSANSASSEPSTSLFTPRPKIKQVETPQLIQSLAPWIDDYRPQVAIRQPNAGQVLDATSVAVNLRVRDLPIYKDETWQLGPHVDLWLDNQPYDSIYDLDQPVVIENLTPGTHTLRAFAVRPWNEIFKNEGAYNQVTFHVFAQTDENSPTTAQPLLTYGSPVGSYGAEPVLLDFYLNDAPLHQLAEENPAISDWRIRYTVNGDSLTLDTWEPIYIEGLKTGQNWVQLELIDEDGDPIEGVFNNTVQLIDYDPTQTNGLATLIQGDTSLEMVGGIVDPGYEPPTPEVLDSDDDLDLENTAETLPSEDFDGSAEVNNEPEIVETESAEDSEVTDKLDLSQPEPLESSDDAAAENILENQRPERSAADIETPADEILDPEPIDVQTNEILDTGDRLIIEDRVPETISEDEPDDSPSQPVESTNTDDELREEGAGPALDENSLPGEPEINPTANGLATDSEVAELEAAPESEISGDNQEDPAIEQPSSSRKYLQRFYDYRERAMGDSAG